MDHSVFWHQGYYYIVSIYLYPDNQFAYSRSNDLCNWEEFPPIPSTRLTGSSQPLKIWAPFVYEENGVFYMFFTTVTAEYTQSIYLTTTTNPADPETWQSQGLVFSPNHEGMVWQPGEWADCRDPMVIQNNGHYYLFYTGKDEDGGIIGVAEATSIMGPWQDQGSMLLSNSDTMLESATMVHYGEYFYLFYNEAYRGEKFHLGPTPLGPWGEPKPLQPGWAHEFWQDQSSAWHTSYLTDYTISIKPLYWESFASPPLPIIGDQVLHLFLPLLAN
jgi:beta-xylosidase